MNIGDKIKKMMELKNINQRQLAKKCKLTESAISKYVNNERYPRIDVLLKLAKVFSVGINYFSDNETTKFGEIKELVARNGKDLTAEEKLELMKLLSR